MQMRRWKKHYTYFMNVKTQLNLIMFANRERNETSLLEDKKKCKFLNSCSTTICYLFNLEKNVS